MITFQDTVQLLPLMRTNWLVSETVKFMTLFERKSLDNCHAFRIFLTAEHTPQQLHHSATGFLGNR